MDGLLQPTGDALQPFSAVWLEEHVAEYAQDADDAVMTPFERHTMIGVVAISGYCLFSNAYSTGSAYCEVVHAIAVDFRIDRLHPHHLSLMVYL